LIVPVFDNQNKDYEIEARIRLKNTSGSGQKCGLCFNLSKELNRGYILEFNNNREFAIKKIDKPGNYTYITDKKSKNHLIKCKMLSKKEEFNNISILCKDNMVDLYINNYFAYSFIDQLSASDTRNVGIYIGAGSQAVVSKFYFLVNSNDKITSDKQITNKTEDNQDINSHSNDIDSDNIAGIIINLKNQVSEMQKDLKDQRILLGKCKEDNSRLNDFIIQNINMKLVDKSKALQQQFDDLNAKYEKLLTENKSLLEFKKNCEEASGDKELLNLLYKQLNNAENEKIKLLDKVSKLENELNQFKEK
jgi:hypothetical protein